MKKLNAQQYNAIKEWLKFFGNEIAMKSKLNALQGSDEPYKIPENKIIWYMENIDMAVRIYSNEE